MRSWIGASMLVMVMALEPVGAAAEEIVWQSGEIRLQSGPTVILVAPEPAPNGAARLRFEGLRCKGQPGVIYAVEIESPQGWVEIDRFNLFNAEVRPRTLTMTLPQGLHWPAMLRFVPQGRPEAASEVWVKQVKLILD